MTIPPSTVVFALPLLVMWPAQAFGQAGQVVEHYHTDALGSVRLVTNAAGQIATDAEGHLRRYDFLPFGEECRPVAPPGVGCEAAPPPTPDKRLFTGKERDTETTFDYFEARYLAATYARFITVDPGHQNGSPNDPQSWNAYAYARNNPLRFTDPTGTDYRVYITGGTDFSFTGTWTEFRAFATGFTLEGGPVSGKILNAAGTQVGRYQYFDSPFDLMAIEVARLAAPPVDTVVNLLRAFGWAVAPSMMAIAECAAGNCDKTGIGLAMLPELGALLRGATLLKMSRVIQYEKAGGFAQATRDFEALAGSERTIGAVKVKTLPDGSKAVLRNFSTEGRPTLEFQNQAGKNIKIRYNQ